MGCKIAGSKKRQLNGYRMGRCFSGFILQRPGMKKKHQIEVADDGTFEMPEGGVSVTAVFEAEEDAEAEEGEEA